MTISVPGGSEGNDNRDACFGSPGTIFVGRASRIFFFSQNNFSHIPRR
jgi:hypothetical protein